MGEHSGERTLYQVAPAMAPPRRAMAFISFHSENVKPEGPSFNVEGPTQPDGGVIVQGFVTMLQNYLGNLHQSELVSCAHSVGGNVRF